MAIKEKKQHYVNSEEFKVELKQYYDSDVMTENLGLYIKKIATGLFDSRPRSLRS